MRHFYDGGGKKHRKYCVLIDVLGDSRGYAAEVLLELYWWDSFENAGKSVTREYTITRQRSADTLYSELLQMFEEAGFYPQPMEQDELHVLITQAVCSEVRGA